MSKKAVRENNLPNKLFIIDTNVLLHDPASLFRFEEHDIYLPIMVLEELDNHKRGTTDVARNARQVTRMIDEILRSHDNGVEGGISLVKPSSGMATGRLFLQCESFTIWLPESLPVGKADNQIIGVALHLQETQPERRVTLVSKDINMRLKARTVNLDAEDYLNDQVIDDASLLHKGHKGFKADFWTRNKIISCEQRQGIAHYQISGPGTKGLAVNEFLSVQSESEGPADAAQQLVVRAVSGKTARLETIKDYSSPRNPVWGVVARNPEQNYALNLLMDPEVDFVTLLGPAGTGKTLLTIAAGLAQVFDKNAYGEIIMTRATVPIGDEIGFLPGTEEEKMQPWMGALEDTLEFLLGGGNVTKSGEHDNRDVFSRAATKDFVSSRVKIKSMSFMRGRTFLKKFLVVDEAQNLTPKQVKTLVTRAGPGTKVVCLGNLAQIDTPYLTEASSGLTSAVERFRNWPHAGHITLVRGERSRLADFANHHL